jgi:hypothetical protein
MHKKKIWANFQRITELFIQKIVIKLSKIWVWDPRSGIRKKPIPDPGSRGHKGTGSRIRIRNTEENYKKFSSTSLWSLERPIHVADLCNEPTPWLERSLKRSYNLSTDISNYYLKCSPNRQNPFQLALDVSRYG